jgi:DinB superfamily
MKTATIFMATLLGAAALSAQSLSNELKMQWEDIRANITKAADRMPDSDYAFKPQGEPRTYAQLITHVADTRMALCGAAKGEQKRINAGSKTSKAEVVAALKESTEFCDSAYAALTDATAVQPIKMFGQDRTRYGALDFNVIHDNETYGSIAVYMRLKNMVPPSTADSPQAGGKKK